MFGTYLAVFILIVVIFYTAKLWMWLYKNAFGINLTRKIIFISLFVGAIAAFGILFSPYIISYFGFSSFTDYTSNYTWNVVLVYLCYLNFLAILLFSVLKAFSKKQLLNLFIFNIYFIILFAIFNKLDLDLFILNTLLYYLFVAYGEEFIKNQLAFLINNKIGKLESDLLLYHILVAIGFAFWENIVYLVGAIGFETFITTLLGGIGIVLLRGVLGFGAHSFYSSLIGMGNILGITSIFIFILFSMLVHYGYDLSLYFNYKIVIPIFIILVYGWISYIFYKIDRLYIE